MDQNEEPIYFIEKPIIGWPSHTFKIPHTYTSAGYAAKVLTEYCYITGIEEEPFKSKQDPDSLIKVAASAVAPITNRNPAGGHVGKSIQLLYAVYATFS